MLLALIITKISSSSILNIIYLIHQKINIFYQRKNKQDVYSISKSI